MGLDLKGLSHVGMSIFGSSATDATLFTYVYVIKKIKKTEGNHRHRRWSIRAVKPVIGAHFCPV